MNLRPQTGCGDGKLRESVPGQRSRIDPDEQFLIICDDAGFMNGLGPSILPLFRVSLVSSDAALKKLAGDSFAAVICVSVPLAALHDKGIVDALGACRGAIRVFMTAADDGKKAQLPCFDQVVVPPENSDDFNRLLIDILVRYRVGKALREATSQRPDDETKQFFDRFLDSILVVDREMRVIRVNREACRFLGYRRDELVGRQISTLFSEPKGIVDLYFDFPSRAIHQKADELRNVKLEFVAADGGRHPVSLNLSRLENDAGETVGVIAGAKDISAFEGLLKKTYRQKRFIEALLDIIPGGVLAIGVDNVLLQYNRRFESFLAAMADKYLYDKDLLSTTILENLSGRLDHQLAGELELDSPTGPFHLGYHASRATSKDSMNYVVFLRDITEEHRQEQARILHSAVLEQTDNAVIVTDIRGVVQYMNRAAEQLSGYSSRQAVGQKTSLFASGLHRDSDYRQLWDTVGNGRIWNGVMTNRNRDGSLYKVEAVISPVRTSHDEITHYVALWRDVRRTGLLPE